MKLKLLASSMVAANLLLTGCAGLPWQKKPQEETLQDVMNSRPGATLSGANTVNTKTSSAQAANFKPAPAGAKTKQSGDDGSNDLGRIIARGRAAEQSKQLDRARSAYEDAIKLYPKDPSGYGRLAKLCDLEKRHTDAWPLYTQAIKLDPNNPVLHNDLGYSLFLAGQLDKSEIALRKAVALSPKESLFHRNLGMVLGHQERYDESLNEFRRAGSEADAYYNMAFVMSTQGNFDEAKNCFRRCLTADPTYEKARKALVNFEQYDNDPSGAEAFFAAEDRNLVPYVESNDGSQFAEGSRAAAIAGRSPASAVVREQGGVQQASANMPAGSVNPRTTSTTSRAMKTNARSTMNQRTDALNESAQY